MSAELFMERSAMIDGDFRYSLWRRWDERLPAAAWLMCNPSTADAEREDPTLRRVIRFSRAAGCGSAYVVNLFSLRSPYPKDLWKWLDNGKYAGPPLHCWEAMGRNEIAVSQAALAASIRFAAFGAEAGRRFPSQVARALDLFLAHGPALALGSTSDGWPLHPLARGKFAIPNDRKPEPWSPPPSLGSFEHLHIREGAI